jgi:LmbE family N-acetylglucosaminyl deacetylase
MKVIIVAPHPDDETLGCGGTILKHKAIGDEVYWLIMTNVSAENGYGKTQVKIRQQEVEIVTQKYGFEKVFKMNFPTTKLDVIPREQLVKTVSTIIHEVKPNIVYLPNRNDVHSDHKVTFDTAISATKAFRHSSIKRILMYETISETEFAPPFQQNAFVPSSFSDISPYFDKKLAIMKIYESELGKHPFPRNVENIKALATFRGATAGVKFAEAFTLVKEIW